MQGLIDHGVAGLHHLNNGHIDCMDSNYKIYFGLGQHLTLINTPEVFKVSVAGIKLGHYLTHTLAPDISNRSFLDIGTGSGVHALLIRALGGHDIIATDISEKSIDQARLHEHINFNQAKISFLVSDLFNNTAGRKFHTIVFNPPGWRTPSPSLLRRLKAIELPGEIPIESMFYGEHVITRFLEDLPQYLEPTGKAIVGLNSLVGIRDVLSRYNQRHNGAPPLVYKLAERHTLPLLYYSANWKACRKHLTKEFEHWSSQDLATYSVDHNGNIYWSYEIIEFSLRTI
ncbi:methyltransferase [Pseudomonas sp. SIMBA_059]